MNMKLKITWICIALFAGSMMASAQSVEQDKNLIKGKLSNGLTYYIYPNKNPKGQAIYRLFIKSGSLYEAEDQRGLAHFLEHMAFNGSADFPNGTLVGYLQSKGAAFGSDINAHTSMNETVYKLQLPSTSPQFVDSSLMVLANWAGSLSLDSAAIEKERGIILSEWLTRTGPKSEVNNAFLLEVLNSSHYTQRLTIGDTAVLKHFTHDKLRSYYHNWYNPKLMAVAVIGDVDPLQVEQIIKRRFAPIVSAPIKVPVYSIDNYKKPTFKSVGNKSVAKIELSILQLTDLPRPVVDEKSFFEYLKRSLINRLTKERFSALLFDYPSYLAGSISNSSIVNTKGVVSGGVELKPGKVMQGIRDYATDAECIYRYGFLTPEIEKVKKSYISTLKRAVTSGKPKESMAYVDEIYSDFYRGNKIVTPQEEYSLTLKYIDRIDSATLAGELRKVRKPSQTHYFMTYNDKVTSELPSEQTILHIFDSLQKADIKPYDKYVSTPENLLSAEPTPGKVVKKEHIEQLDAHRITFSNGACVTYKQSDIDKNRISVGAYRRGGLSAIDSSDYVSGLFATQVIPLSGAGEFSRDALRYFMAGSTASARFIISKNRSGIIAGANSDDYEQMFQLIYLKWCFPKMDTSILNQTKKLTIESARTELKTETDKFNREVALLLSGSDYTNRQLNDTIINRELNAEKLLPIFNSNFGGAKDFEFIIVSDAQMDSIMPLIEKYIGGLPAGEGTAEYKYGGPRIPKGDTTHMKSVGENPKATVSMFFQTDAPIAELRLQNLMGDVVKNIVRTKLLKSLREQLNKVYSVSVSAGATEVPGELNRVSIAFACQSEDVDTLVGRTMAELRAIVADTSAFESELKDVKLNLTKNWNAERQKGLYLSSGIRNVLYRQDKDWSYLTHYDKAIESVTAAEVAKYVNDYILGVSMTKAVLLPKK